MILPLYRRPAPARPDLHDIEETVARCHPLLEGACLAGYLPGRAGPRLIVVAEMSRRLHRMLELDLTGEDNPMALEVQEAVRASVAARHRATVHAVHLLPRHSIPVTITQDPTAPHSRGAYLENIAR
jgi:hypothetical protein